MKYLRLTPGYRTALADGALVPDSPKHMATEELYRAFPGSRIRLCEKGYVFAPAVFSLERNPLYIYSYAYQPEENWAVYTQNLTGGRSMSLTGNVGSASASEEKTGKI